LVDASIASFKSIAKWRKHERKKFNQDRASKSGIYPAHSLTSFLIQESAELAPEFVIKHGQDKNCQYDEFGFRAEWQSVKS
jgi:hypothetical protein